MLLDGLPRNSHYEQAKSEDEDVALMLEGVPKTRPKPPLAEYTRELEVLMAMDRRLVNLVSLMARRKTHERPWPVPETGESKLARQRAREASAHIESMLRYPDGRKLA